MSRVSTARSRMEARDSAARMGGRIRRINRFIDSRAGQNLLVVCMIGLVLMASYLEARPL